MVVPPVAVITMLVHVPLPVPVFVHYGALVMVMVIPALHDDRRVVFVTDDHVAAAVEQLRGGKDGQDNYPLRHDGAPCLFFALRGSLPNRR